ncbi:MAG: DNA topoisomerase IV subunit A [Candidatus Marinimicrobia bacterium]|nr:DNA topoisomerase IV subunit A [Candidatus Neomarinimicrobiota bacterium]
MNIDLEKIIKESDKTVERLPVKDFSEKAYLNYSMYVILDRALPNISDGLKPVQRRILYAMSELALTHTSKFKKSARTIGDVLGKFHPHGDTACYEAMVMLAQDFSYNHPFIEGQGNWGTQDDPKSFAAMRYTESRLTRFSDIFLDEINMGTVKWSPNFDGTLDEPKTLPSKVPNILINGSSGIAVGMSTDIPSHNLKETIDAVIALLDKPKLSISDLRKIILGPDFPTKGELLLNESELEDIYKTGTGNIKLRATYKVIGKEIIIDSIPYQANTNKIIEQIQDQIYLKKSMFIGSVLDASDQDHPVRIVLKTKGRSHEPVEIMSHLFFTTDLEKSLRVNLNMIGLDGKPQVKNLHQILSEWIKYRLSTIKNKLSWELAKIKRRIHILDAYIIVYNNLDKVIKIIRNEDDPKKKIIKLFKFSNEQYEAIINLKIRNLAKLQEKNIIDELKELKSNEKMITALLNSKARLKTYLKSELKEIIKNFSRERRTRISNGISSKEIEVKQIISSDPITSVLSKNGWIKFSKGHDISEKQFTFKTGDEYLLHEETYTDKSLVFIDELGYVYNLDSTNIAITRGQGDPLSKYFQIQDGIHIIGMHSLNENLCILTMTNLGYGFICLHDDLFVKNKKGKTLIRTKDSYAIKSNSVDLDNDIYYLLITSDNYMIISALKNIPILSKGRGVKLINIPKSSNETIIFSGILREGQSLSFSYDTKRSKKLDYDALKLFIMQKNRRGKKIDKKFLLEKGKTTYKIE